MRSLAADWARYDDDNADSKQRAYEAAKRRAAEARARRAAAANADNLTPEQVAAQQVGLDRSERSL